MEPLVFEYSPSDFILNVENWESTSHLNSSLGLNFSSKFDELMCKQWDLAQRNGCFRYTLDHIVTKILGGKYNFVAQLNIKRAVERRKPQFISNLSQPFNSNDFNFTKVAFREILFHVKKLEAQHTVNDNLQICHQMIINVSPLEYGNSLFVPFINSCFPQILTFESIKMAIELMCCSSNKAFRTGFNSLCANASVNHHHFHVFYLNYELPVETIGVENVTGECYAIADYPASGFAFQLIDLCNIDVLSKIIYAVANFLQLNNIAHNLFITRGTTFNAKDKNYNSIRIYLWARNSEFGSKDDTAFNIACCELSGHLPVKKNDSFETITEALVGEVLSGACNTIFNDVLPKVKTLLLQL